MKLLAISVAVMLAFGTAVGFAAVRRAEVIQRVAKSTVVVYAKLDGEIAQGSGTVVGRSGQYTFVLTCSHVVEGSLSLKVRQTRSEAFSNASIEMDDPIDDLALLVVKDFDAAPVLPVGAAPKLYDTVYVVGAPESQQGTASEGMITDLGGDFYHVTNAFVMEGISGGTAVNLEGELIGVPARRHQSTTQLGLLVPITTVTKAFGGYLHHATN